MQALRAFLLLAILGTVFGRTSDTNQDEAHGNTAATHYEIWISLLGMLAPIILPLLKLLSPLLYVVGINTDHLISLLCSITDCE